jgi:hypothetical protein
MVPFNGYRLENTDWTCQAGSFNRNYGNVKREGIKYY